MLNEKTNSFQRFAFNIPKKYVVYNPCGPKNAAIFC